MGWTDLGGGGWSGGSGGFGGGGSGGAFRPLAAAADCRGD